MEILEVLKYVLPSIIVFGTAYYLLKMMIDSEHLKKKAELNLENRKLITPIRLQSYERLVIFLERISPDSLLVRTQQPYMTAREMQMALLSAIRTEYEHNISQQIFVSNDAWQAVKTAKENTIKLINSVSDAMSPESTAMDLSKGIIEVIMHAETTPVLTAIEILKEEVRTQF